MRFFAMNGEVEIGVRELARALKINAGNVQRELTKLRNLGLLELTTEVTSTYSSTAKLRNLAKKVEF